MQRVEERQIELAALIRSNNQPMHEHALRAAACPPKPALRSQRGGARRRSEDDFKLHGVLLDLQTRFNYWMQAWRTIHRRLGVDGRPPVPEIYDLAAVRRTARRETRLK